MTESKQSNNAKEKVSYVLEVQDIDSTTATTCDTSFNVEQHKKMIKSLREGGSTSGSFTILYSAMLCRSRPLSLTPLSTQNYIPWYSVLNPPPPPPLQKIGLLTRRGRGGEFK